MNLASRITGVAEPGTVFASSELRLAAQGFPWTPAGTHKLKGIEEEIAVYRIEPGSSYLPPGHAARTGSEPAS